MKTYVIILSKNFPTNHSKAGDTTYFEELVLMGIKKIHMGESPSTWKLHTIRENYSLWAKRMEEVAEGRACISLRQWSGRPYFSEQVELFNLKKENGVGIEPLIICPKSGAFIVDNGDQIHKGSIQILAENDGLYLSNFLEWFPMEKRGKLMAIIHFTKFRYIT